MGRKTKTVPKSNGSNHSFLKSGVKRKKQPKASAPPSKRPRNDHSYPGKYVLINPPKQDSTSSESERIDEKSVNGNVPEQSQLEKIFDNTLSESDDEWMSGELETDSMSGVEEESCSVEWSTDTDFTGDEYSLSDSEEHSFHESDCMSVTEDEDNNGDYGYEESSEDSDYVPAFEDKYIKLGDAILYDGKGLDLAFGDSHDSRIIEINEIQPAFENEGEEEEVPLLVGDDGIPPSVTALVEDFNLENEEETLETSKLQNRASFIECGEGIVVQLRDTIHFHGILIVRALANKVQINGFTLEEGDSMTVSSISRADYFLNLTPVIDDIEELSEDVTKLVDVPTFNSSTEALVYLEQGLPDNALEMLKTYSPHPLLPSKKMLLTNSPCPSAELRLATKFFIADENQKIDSFTINEQWKNVELESRSRIVVIGGKNVGKSTLSQFIVNRNIRKFKKILLIDLDIGQPICATAQTVTATVITKPIIGPGYLSDNIPAHCLFYGDKNVMTSPFKYVRCVKELMRRCEEFKDIPWVINTMGYHKGFGLQLTSLLIRILQPTDLVQMQHSIKSYNFSTIVTESFVNSYSFSLFDDSDLENVPSTASFTTHVLDSIVNNRGDDNSWVSNATDKRKLSMLAQLSKLVPERLKSLNEVTPFRTSIVNLRMVVMDEEYSQAFNIDLLNGSLVYLCHASIDTVLDTMSILDCFGIGIVRGIDKINEQIYILLPQSSKLQEKFNVLAIGNIPLPAEILLKQNYSISGKVPYVTFFRDRNATSRKYVNKKGIKDCF